MLAFPNSYDSLWFSSDSGLVRRVWSRCLDLDQSGWYYWRTAVLLSRTITSVRQETRLPETTVLLQNYP
ncbi:MAG: hypothetical protein KF749_14830, partial [Bacteroidetes bacterium]|nr:hypothetical protein [Bacteroidota bacterium]